MKFNKDTFEIIFFARGGQGGKTASELVAHAAVDEGKYVKAFPFFGPERSGAPTKFYLRISQEPIRTQEPINDPDVVVVMDETVMDSEYVTKNLEKDETLLVNSKHDAEILRSKVPGFKGKIYAIDAGKIALETTGNPNPNMPLIGKLLALTEVVSRDAAEKIFREIFTEKIGKELTEKNITALEKGYDAL